MNRRLVPGHQQRTAQVRREPFRFLYRDFPDLLVGAVLYIDLTIPVPPPD